MDGLPCKLWLVMSPIITEIMYPFVRIAAVDVPQNYHVATIVTG